VSVLDEAATQFAIWCHKASPLFAGREPQGREVAGAGGLARYVRQKPSQ